MMSLYCIDNEEKAGGLEMFHQYFVYYDGRFAGTVMALSEQSAKDKGCQLVGVSASAYTGKARRLVEVVRR